MPHVVFFFFSSRRRHTRFDCDWSSDVCSSDLDPERHHDADHAGREEAHHNVGGVQRAERLDDEVAEAPARLAAQELADDDADQRERDGRRERGEGPGGCRGHDDRAHALPLRGAEEARRVDQVGVDTARALERVEEDDEEHDRPREHDLRQEPEAEDHRDEWHEGDARERVERDDERLEDAREPVPPPEHEPGGEPRGDADDEPPERGLHRRERHRPDGQADLPGGEVGEAAEDHRGPANEERVDPVEAGGRRDRLDSREPLPRADEDHEDQKPPAEDPRSLGHCNRGREAGGFGGWPEPRCAAAAFRMSPCTPPGSASSSPSTRQITRYSCAYSSVSRSLITSRGRGMPTSWTSFTRPGRRVMTMIRSASVIASERPWVTKTTVWWRASHTLKSSAWRASLA